MDKKRKRTTEPGEQTRQIRHQSSVPNSTPDNSENWAEDFYHLLDLSSLSNHEDISDRFEAIAQALLHDFYFCFVADGTENKFELLEAEFYLKSPEHDDPFTHGSDEQKGAGRWYFHRTPRKAGAVSSAPIIPTAAGGYRGGTRKGLDLTIGRPLPPSVKSSRYFTQQNPSPAKDLSSGSTSSALSSLSEMTGGVLLRSIRRLSDGNVSSGPSLLVDQLLRLGNASNVQDLVSNKWGGDISVTVLAHDAPAPARTCLFLRKRPPPGTPSCSTPPTIYASPRIGLDLTNPAAQATPDSPRVAFVSRPYRFFIHPEKLTAYGRMQTFIGTCAFLAGGETRSENAYGKELSAISPKALEGACTLMALKLPSGQGYIEAFREGYETMSLKTFVGAAGKNALRSTGYLAMVGAVQRSLEAKGET
ncbi:hypothetical protein CONPUDRAFT_158529 [Coniophora puteana RWD-64-598 SS2]|uniref:Uncharacterized protein n=1 Tax=Coniophora puteana (strain RWD-64-598) TaxID=741705 RepID=A0A5M3MBA5_CONPW|nr:uncharacterized protein CONPUDRAFT_158529 [Coniophora puteana RWD-64-598 SS2]EIW76512.1 hypothetical protein CONPUDRAFT_158529 [Coniophora puteana RWD-64-598 SS2]